MAEAVPSAAILPASAAATLDDAAEATGPLGTGTLRAVPLLDRPEESLEGLGRAGVYFTSAETAPLRALAERLAKIAPSASLLVHALPQDVRVSGIAWSEHPGTGSLDQIVVDAVPGLPESLFAGLGSPERVTVDPAAFRENGRFGASLRGVARADAQHDGGYRIERRDPSEPHPILTLEEAGKVARLVARAMNATDSAVEVVWAIGPSGAPEVWEIRFPSRRADERLRRALVAHELGRLRERYRFAQELFTRDSIDKILDVPTPMTRSLFERISGPDGARGRSLKWLGFPFDPDENQKCYSFLFDHAFIDTAAGFRALTAGLPLDIDASRHHLAASAEIRDLPKHLNFSRMTARDWLRLPLTALQVAAIPLRTTWHAFHLRKGYDERTRPELFAWIDRHRGADLTTYDAAALAGVVEEGERRIQHVYAQHQMADIFSILPIKMIERLTRLAGRDPFPFFNSTRLEVEAIYRRRCDRELLEVAEGKRARAEFLEEHGYRATPEWEFAEPRWREDAALLDEQVRRVREGAGVRKAGELRTAEEVARE
ncbi:MAG: hypothetical protein KC466_13590, partial [Myxococcales bacterium]|nr:hypothetical protein [Myxococcales bacterium]